MANKSAAPHTVQTAAGLRKEDRADKPTISLSALREQAGGLRRAQLMANLAHVITKPDGSFESWSETLPELLGISEEQVVGSTRRWLDLIHPADRARFRETALEARARGSRVEVHYRLWRNDGRWVHVRQVMEPITANATSTGHLRWFNTLQDISEHVSAQERISRLNRVYAVLSGINGAIVRIHERQALLDEACRIAVHAGGFVMAWVGLIDHATSLVRPAATAGNVGDFFATAPMAILETTPGGHGLAGQAVRTKRPVISQDVKSDSQRLMRKELGERNINSLAILPLIVHDEVVGTLALYASDVGFFDPNEMRLLEELAGDVSFALDNIEKAKKLEYVTHYDSLTDVPNRALFYERLKLQLQDASRKGERLAVKLVDIERFKSINDSLGRQAGDALLVEVVKRMQNVRRDAGWIARVGGDQFAIVTPNVVSEEKLAAATGRRFSNTFTPVFNVRGTEVRLSARMGIAVYPEDGNDSDVLLRNAEAALKKAKEAGDKFLFYRPEMTARIAEKLSLENQLHRALANDEFVLHYQPKVQTTTRRIVGLEALIRWQSPERGLVPPMKFIPLLEETGLILDVGAWALKRAALDHREWHERGLNAPKVAVNVSAIQLRQRNFVSTIEQALGGGLSSAGIDLEITESVVMEDIQATMEKLLELRRLGVAVAIDDFGTGYSSLAYLARLPVETLKIDRSFVNAMVDDPNARTLVQTIVSLAHSLELKVVAEGVETEAQATLLKGLACDEMQGYLFSKPLPPADIVHLLTR